MSTLRPSGRTALVILAYAPTISVPFVVAALAAWAPAGHWCDQGGVKVVASFAPGPGPSNQLVWAINSADKSIRVMAYSFTDGDIADALIRAKARGVDVRVMLDDYRVKEPGSVAPQLLKAGVSVSTDAAHPIFHFKAVVVDEKRVLMGSYNFTRQAHRNGEVLLDLECEPVAKDFLAVWEIHARHAEAYPADKP